MKCFSYHQRQHPLLQRVTGLSFLLGIITNSVIVSWFFIINIVRKFYFSNFLSSFSSVPIFSKISLVPFLPKRSKYV